MTPQTDEAMRSLIERLEKATWPSRIIDNAIHDYLKPERLAALEYTASIDAALTLVPDGYAWKLRHNCSADGDSVYCNAQVWPFSNPRDEEAPRYWANADEDAPALALCIAALKARLAQKEKEKDNG